MGFVVGNAQLFIRRRQDETKFAARFVGLKVGQQLGGGPASEFLRYFEEGKSIALVSDAGMPGVSDPGERLIRAAVEAGVAVEVIPGPSAPVTALVGSGLPMVPYYFGGFLPVKSGQRRKELARAIVRDCTSVYFESPYRVVRMLEDAVAEIPQMRACVARELTKKFEEFRRGSPAELLEHFKAHEPRGEFCLVLAPPDEKLRVSNNEPHP